MQIGAVQTIILMNGAIQSRKWCGKGLIKIDKYLSGAYHAKLPSTGPQPTAIRLPSTLLSIVSSSNELGELGDNAQYDYDRMVRKI